MMEFPKAMYHEDGHTTTANSPAAVTALGTGWSDKPSDIHRQPADSVGAHVAPSGQSDFAMLVAATVLEQMAERFDLQPKVTAESAAAALDPTGKALGPKTSLDTTSKKAPSNG